ncbi:MAG: STAS domain-containing protein [Candidatus Eremiobacteraeota bacterium]|nr:STAS domain-containing protein [Candidatus Eremiobacteraeota bacterium]
MNRASASRRVMLQGEYDLTRKAELATLFGTLDGDDDLVFDLTNVTYLDSTILEELAALRRQSNRRSITLAGANAHIRRVFHIVGFDRIFHTA